MFTYLYAVKFSCKNKDHKLSLILVLENEKEIPENTIEKRVVKILEKVGFKDIYYIERLERIIKEKIQNRNGIFTFSGGYDYLKTIVQKDKKGYYEVRYYETPNVSILNILLDKKLNIYSYYGGYGQYQDYCYHEAKEDFGRFYHISDVTSNIFSLKDENGKADYKSIRSIVEENQNIQFVFLFPSFVDINDLYTILSTYYDCINIDVYVIDINYVEKIYRKVSLDGDQIIMRKVFLS